MIKEASENVVLWEEVNRGNEAEGIEEGAPLGGWKEQCQPRVMGAW